MPISNWSPPKYNCSHRVYNAHITGDVEYSNGGYIFTVGKYRDSGSFGSMNEAKKACDSYVLEMAKSLISDLS